MYELSSSTTRLQVFNMGIVESRESIRARVSTEIQEQDFKGIFLAIF